MNDKVQLLLQFAKGNEPKKHKFKLFELVNGVKTLVNERETDADMDISIVVVTNQSDLRKIQ